jgi:hypothetical protein
MNLTEVIAPSKESAQSCNDVLHGLTPNLAIPPSEKTLYVGRGESVETLTGTDGFVEKFRNSRAVML